jgi:hypothetical protein
MGKRGGKMDKQKQINEMHQILLSAGYDWWETYPNGNTKSEYEAECFYNAGYRKIPENAVVILDEEMEEFAETLLKSPQMQKTMNRLIKAWEKETAEKFAQALENRLDSIDTILHEDNEEEYLSANGVGELIDEICKEIIGDDKNDK